jgi:hypothetical protein
MSVTIQFRRQTAALWTSNNPILNLGELGIETDTKKFKIGDGSTHWASLAYVSPTETSGNIPYYDVGDGYYRILEGNTTLSFTINGVTYSTPAWTNTCGCQCPCTCTCTCPCTCQGVTSSGSSSGCGCCFIGSTKIMMSNGTYKSIEEIDIGDEVTGRIVAGALGLNKVIGIFKHDIKNQNLYSINDSDYFFTEDHPFMTQDGWKSLNPELTSKTTKLLVKKLTNSDLVITQRVAKNIKNISSKKENVVVYSLVLDGDKTYYANDYLVYAYTEDKCQ